TAKPKPGDPLAAFFQNVMKTDLKAVFKPDMTIRKIEGLDAIKHLTGGNPQLAALTQHCFTESAVKLLIEMGFAGLPRGPVIHGESWTRQSSLDLGAIGGYTFLDRYRYEGVENGLDRIAVTSLVKYALPRADQKAGMPFVITKGD